VFFFFSSTASCSSVHPFCYNPSRMLTTMLEALWSTVLLIQGASSSTATSCLSSTSCEISLLPRRSLLHSHQQTHRHGRNRSQHGHSPCTLNAIDIAFLLSCVYPSCLCFSCDCYWVQPTCSLMVSVLLHWCRIFPLCNSLGRRQVDAWAQRNTWLWLLSHFLLNARSRRHGKHQDGQWDCWDCLWTCQSISLQWFWHHTHVEIRILSHLGIVFLTMGYHFLWKVSASTQSHGQCGIHTSGY
jgi:hypothetical protein